MTKILRNYGLLISLFVITGIGLFSYSETEAIQDYSAPSSIHVSGNSITVDSQSNVDVLRSSPASEQLVDFFTGEDELEEYEFSSKKSLVIFNYFNAAFYVPLTKAATHVQERLKMNVATTFSTSFKSICILFRVIRL